MELEYKSIQTKNGVAGYVCVGSGSPIVMIVGYSGTLYHWNSNFINCLAKHHTLYMVDNRKIGLSDSNNPESMPGFAKDIADFIDAMQLDRPAILGWSMGGVVSQELARIYPDKISKLILLATVPQITLVTAEFMQFMATTDQYSVHDYKQELYHFFFSEDATSQIQDYIRLNASVIKGYHYRFTENARNLQNQVIPFWGGMTKEDLAQIKLPVLILWAKNDLVVPKSAIDFFTQNLPNLELKIYDSGGHFLIYHNYESIRSEIAGMIKK